MSVHAHALGGLVGFSPCAGEELWVLLLIRSYFLGVGLCVGCTVYLYLVWILNSMVRMWGRLAHCIAHRKFSILSHSTHSMHRECMGVCVLLHRECIECSTLSHSAHLELGWKSYWGGGVRVFIG